MMRMLVGRSLRPWLLILVWTISIQVASYAAPSAPLEPKTYRQDDYRAPTPLTLDGVPALTTAEAHALWLSNQALFIDVLPRPPKPKELSLGTVWRDKPRENIPGSLWLADTGYGQLAPQTEVYLRHNLAKATVGDFGKTLVFYCLRDCWMSWNAAKRAKSFGYNNVLWYADGTDGWNEADLPLKASEPEPRDVEHGE
jgi:PQQ-dependent catabolism-associated CXXCW motif protein